MTYPIGNVYGVLLNNGAEFELWQSAMLAPPYKGVPRAPVLYIKTANTWSLTGTEVPVPWTALEVELGATIGLIFDRDVMRGDAGIDAVSHCLLLNDLSLPNATFFRPPVRHKNLDGFLGIGAKPVPLAQVGDLAALRLAVNVDGELRQIVTFDRLVRDARTLVNDVADFMTLCAGDVLMLGLGVSSDGRRPRAHIGQRIEITAPGFEPLVNLLVAEVP